MSDFKNLISEEFMEGLREELEKEIQFLVGTELKIVYTKAHKEGEEKGRKDEREKEVCICAAVKTTTGKIFRGHRHSDCMSAIRERHFLVVADKLGQGFITSKNRYVDRAEGYKLQTEAGIESAEPLGKYCQEGQLYSEDLY